MSDPWLDLFDVRLRLDLRGNEHLVSVFDSNPPPTLAELLDRPAWHADALCREYPDLSWFVGPGVSVTRQRSICNRCAVRVECLADALDRQEQHGLWGGLTLVQRRRLAAEAA